MPDEALQRPEPAREPSRGSRRLLAARWVGLRSERTLVVVFLVVIVALSVSAYLWPDEVPISVLFPIVVLAALLLSPRPLSYVYGVTLVGVAAWMTRSDLGPVRLLFLGVSMLVVMWMMSVSARSRSLVGTRGFGGDRMFAELRDRIASVGTVPDLPEGWKAYSCILSAYGDRFSGDFVVAHLSASGHRLEIVLVDVSGKGTRAGTRSLLLSGALGGLLGAVPSADFLRAANEYLVRQGWEEGFATAVHLDLDLRTG